MAVTITSGVVEIEPVLRLGYRAETESRNVLHDIVGQAAPDVSLADDGLRSGTLELFFDTATGAEAARLALMTGVVWTLVDDIALVDMSFVRTGRMTIEQQRARLRWVLSVGFQEVDS